MAGLVATDDAASVRRPVLVLWLPSILATFVVFIAAGVPERCRELVAPPGMAPCAPTPCLR